jgi:SAM-dependent methyltransferase
MPSHPYLPALLLPLILLGHPASRAESPAVGRAMNAYHHFEYPRAMLDSIRAALVPGGILAIVDFGREPGVSNRWILGEVEQRVSS